MADNTNSKDAVDERRMQDLMRYRTASSIPEVQDRFELKTIKYPENLGASDLKHRVEFAINIRGKSKFKKQYDTYEGYEVRRDNNAQISPEKAGNAFDKIGTLTLGAGAISYFGAKNIFKLIPGVGGKGLGGAAARTAATSATIVAAGEGINQTIGAVRKNVDILKPDKMERMKDVITLHIEERPAVKYSAEYSTKSLGTLAGLLSQSSTLTGSLADVVKSGEAKAALAAAIGKIPQMAGIAATDLLRASAKVTPNPFREVLFEQLDFRTFSFKYRFLPKSDAESLVVKKIINTFKEHMLPEVSPEKLFFIFPSEFQITYYFGDELNSYFHKFGACALEDMQVEYGSSEGFSSFRSGAPTEIILNLQFRELELITREKAKEGY
jgi:hypothetical protein